MILKRIKEYIDHKGISIAKFERSIGMSNASFGRSLKNGGAIGTDKLENILNVYPDIDPAWLLKGIGEMTLEGDTPDPKDTSTVNLLLNRIEKLAAENAILKGEAERITDTPAPDKIK